MLELADVINRLTGNEAGVVFQPLPHQDDPKKRKPDITRARSILGWEPKTSLEAGLMQTIAWFSEQMS
jgi:nucleoside-diphosphate-sugar epimerase